MTIQARRLASRLLLILALVAALLAGVIAVQWEMGRSAVAHTIGASLEPQYLAPVGNGDLHVMLLTFSLVQADIFAAF